MRRDLKDDVSFLTSISSSLKAERPVLVEEGEGEVIVLLPRMLSFMKSKDSSRITKCLVLLKHNGGSRHVTPVHEALVSATEADVFNRKGLLDFKGPESGFL